MLPLLISFTSISTSFLILSTSLLLSVASTQQEVSSTQYLSLPAQEKVARLWANCARDTTSSPWLGLLQQGLVLLLEDMCPTYKTRGDELPTQKDGTTRIKVIHTVGTVGRVEWKSHGGHPYTGIFQGANHGLVRFSLALEPNPAARNTVPGMGLKFLRNGRDSANLVAMYSVNGQDSWNFFRNNFSTHIPPVGLLLTPLAVKFTTATKNIRQVGLSDWARYGEDGQQVFNLVFPYRLVFKPNGDLSFPDSFSQDTVSQLVTIPAGSTLYRVFALDKPTELGGQEQHIGDLVLVSKMIASGWGDRNLLFRHQDMAEDLRLKPEWNRDTPQYSIFKKDPRRPSPCGE